MKISGTCSLLFEFIVFISSLLWIQTDGPTNLDFEDGEVGKVPTGWFAPKPSTDAGYEITLSDDRPNGGKHCTLISRARGDGTGAFGNLMQSFEAGDFRGKRVRFKADVRAAVAGVGNQAQLWLRVDRKDGQPGFFDNMGDRPITINKWNSYEISGDIAPDAETINIGCFLLGDGKAWLDDVSFEIIGDAGVGLEAAKPFEGRGLDNVIAFTRLLGYVRYFHPSDEAAETKWDTFAVEGVIAAEKAKSPEELATILETHFRPIAPTVRVYPTGQPQPDDVPMEGATKHLAWRHLGVDTGGAKSIYSSSRVNIKRPRGTFGRKLPEIKYPQPDQPLIVELPGGVTCRVPLAVPANGDGTLPKAMAKQPTATKPDGFLLTGDDRATRLAAVALAWNVAQHFYPYFDVVKTDWPVELEKAMTAAATDHDEFAFEATLKRLVAALQDGHGNVRGKVGATSALPLLWDWVENQLVVTHVLEGKTELERGDVIVSVNGKPAGEALGEVEQLVSGSTSQWNRYIGVTLLASGKHGSEVTLQVKRGDLPVKTVKVVRNLVGDDYQQLKENKPTKIAELKPGIMYVDTDRITDREFARAVPELKKAKGIIFDLRGYPRLSTKPIGHITTKSVTCAQWNVPVAVFPDRKDVAFSFSNWTVEPLEPHFDANIAFVTDGRAISYAETYLGIIEHYKLAEIVGGPTAGTNGNINKVTLPGGYNMVFTGMRVLKHDGSRHHGLGIQPTVPVTRTIAGVTQGKDELLEKAIEVVEGKK